MVNAGKNRPAPRRKGLRAGIGRRRARSARSRQPALSRTEIAELASQMHVPEGILQLVLSHYPELARPLARHRDLSPSRNAATAVIRRP